MSTRHDGFLSVEMGTYRKRMAHTNEVIKENLMRDHFAEMQAVSHPRLAKTGGCYYFTCEDERTVTGAQDSAIYLLGADGTTFSVYSSHQLHLLDR